MRLIESQVLVWNDITERMPPGVSLASSDQREETAGVSTPEQPGSLPPGLSAKGRVSHKGNGMRRQKKTWWEAGTSAGLASDQNKVIKGPG